MIKIISWNIARRHAAWRCLPDSDVDIVLLQEAGLPPDDVNARVTVAPAPFGGAPKDAAHQLDFVFASESMVDSVRVSALNDPTDWGPSDHCRVEIVIES